MPRLVSRTLPPPSNLILILYWLIISLSDLGPVGALAAPRLSRRSVLGAPIVAMTASSASLEGGGRKGARPIGWGIVGLGDVTAVKSGPAFRKAEGSTLVAVMRRTPGAAQAWVDRNIPSGSGGGKVAAYDDLAEFLADPNVDAIYIATPPGSHLEVALRVAEAGLPCYVEKPVGRSAAETFSIFRAFEERQVPLFTAYISRAYERTQAVKRLMAEGAVGERVTSITYRLRGSGGARGMDKAEELPWRLRASLSGGGLIMDVGCHVIDRIDYLCGPLVGVRGEAENRSSPGQAVEDRVAFRAKIGPSDRSAVESTGANVDCEWVFGGSEDDAVDELVITGPGGSLRMAAMSPSLPVDVRDTKGVVLRTMTFDPPQHAAQPLIQLVTDELRGKVGASPSRGDNALRTSRVIDEVLGAYYGGREDDFWAREDTWPGNPSKKGPDK